MSDSSNPQEVYSLIDKIVEDPNHTLPEGITAIIKNAEFHSGKYISGTIWYDRNKRFPDGYGINTSRIVAKELGGIYITYGKARYLVEFVAPEDYNIEINKGK